MGLRCFIFKECHDFEWMLCLSYRPIVVVMCVCVCVCVCVCGLSDSILSDSLWFLGRLLIFLHPFSSLSRLLFQGKSCKRVQCSSCNPPHTHRTKGLRWALDESVSLWQALVSRGFFVMFFFFHRFFITFTWKPNAQNLTHTSYYETITPSYNCLIPPKVIELISLIIAPIF